MYTPQDIQEISFEKAVFGGYDMQSVDEVLEPLTQDYLTLYKENAILKSKMRLMVEKLEEYRANEEAIKAAQAEAQKKCDDMIAEAERRCAAMVEEARSRAETQARSTDAAVTGEQERLERAKGVTRDFIFAVEGYIKRQLEVLNGLKEMNLDKAPAAAPAAPAEPARHEPVRRAYDYDSESDDPRRTGAASAAREAAEATADKIADEIEHNVERIVGDETPAPQEPTKPIPTIRPERAERFENLQFGPNYNPTK